MQWGLCVHISFVAVVFNFQGVNGNRRANVSGQSWNYSGDPVGDKWYHEYPKCLGERQSPIDIVTSDVLINRRLTHFDFGGYYQSNAARMSLQNNGHTVQVELEGQITISGGDLPGLYIAQQFHFHWGLQDSRGSEHTINGKAYPMEMHIVHYNNKYASIDEAMKIPNGLAVFAFFFKVGKFNPKFQKLIKYFKSVAYKDSAIEIRSLSIRALLPEKFDDYYRYHGSLTTPPCFETVIWTVFKDAIEISETQLNEYRHRINENHEGDTEKALADDFRPVQPLRGRRIYANRQFTVDSSGQTIVSSLAILTMLLVVLTTL